MILIISDLLKAHTLFNLLLYLFCNKIIILENKKNGIEISHQNIKIF